MCGDGEKLRQVVANLLGNVRMHTPAGTHTVVTVREEAGGSGAAGAPGGGPGSPRAGGDPRAPGDRSDPAVPRDRVDADALRAGADPAARRAAVIEVADDGPGLTAEQAGRVFERFYRADKSRSRAHGGAGLGLSIVAAIVDAHGGSVSAAPAAGGGAVFTVRLPVDAATPPA